MLPASSFDLVVVGGGLAGSSLAVTLAREGVDVLMVEREREPQRIANRGAELSDAPVCGNVS